jgi:replication fork clamp-binding protein CrfC
MTQTLPQCQNLQAQVNSLLGLLHQQPSLRSHDTTPVQASLRKAISPTFEIVFAGAFSAGKSMLINALLERELLYSAQGHATGTECYIAYAEPDSERVVLTFLSEAEIREQAAALCQRLGLTTSNNLISIPNRDLHFTAAPNIDTIAHSTTQGVSYSNENRYNQPEVINLLRQGCGAIIQHEGGESKSERAKQATALDLLLEGFVANRERIHTVNNEPYSMEHFNFSNLKEAASYARRGSNSAVLKRIEYYCHHPLLRDGNVIIDTPGIDAPVRKDAQLAYKKIENPDTSAVVCVFKTAATGELTSEETELIERMQRSPGIRDRVFNVFNRVDETWFDSELRQRLEYHINSQFWDSTRVYKTSGLLGFYGSQIKQTCERDRWGLDSIFTESVKSLDGREETPQFVNEFIRYCLISEKLSPIKFPIPPSVLQATTNNDKYIQILNALGTLLIEQLIQDSGIEEFRTAITRYLTEEKRPQLFENLADDLQPICISLKKQYLENYRELDSQPREIEAMKARELEQLSRELKDVGDKFCQHIKDEVSEVVNSANVAFNEDFQKLKARMVRRLHELLDTFSVNTAHKRATMSHRRNSVVPLLAILAEAFYYLANELENVLVECSREVVANFFQRLIDRVRKADYYSQLYRLLGNDGGVEQNLKLLEKQVTHGLVTIAETECDRYVRERPEFYTEGTCSMWQLRQTLQQTCRSYHHESMKEAEPAIRQLLKLDFDPKVSETVHRSFRQRINQTLNTHLLPGADQQADEILQQYNQARTYLEKTLEKEAEEKIKSNQRQQDDVKRKIGTYNQAVAGINSCLEEMKLDRKKLPLINESDFMAISPGSEAFDISPVGNGMVESDGISDVVKVELLNKNI